MASVRFICGTQAIHKELEDQLSDWLGMEDTILYPSCFDANGGLFETLLGAEDAVISDELNHASIIDGVRLCKAQRYRYKNADMADLEAQLKAADAAGARFKLIATDGVFSMDGYIAPLDEICDLAERYDALVHVDDSHATGVVGAGGRGTPEHCGVHRPHRHRHRHARQGAGRRQRRLHQRASKEIVELLRQRSRPYLFSNTVAAADGRRRAEGGRARRGGRRPARAAPRQHALLPRRPDRGGLRAAPRRAPDHPGHAPRRPPRAALAEALLKKGVYVIAFSYPVVPKGKARRIRTPISATHTREELERRGRRHLRRREPSSRASSPLHPDESQDP